MKDKEKKVRDWIPGLNTLQSIKLNILWTTITQFKLRTIKDKIRICYREIQVEY